MMRRYLAVSAVVLVLDQLSKLAATRWLDYRVEVPVAPFFNLSLAHNRGAAFSFLSDASGWQHWFFSGIALIVSVVIVLWLRRLKPEERQVGWALSLVLGGAIGNVVDRLRLGYVVDFVDFYVGAWHWPTFNVADSAISVGAVLLALDAFGIRVFGRSGARSP